MSLFPQLLTHSELREDFLSLSFVHGIDWLAPLLVLMDYFTYYQDTNSDQLEAFMDFMLGVTASMGELSLAKTLKGAYFGNR